MFASEPWEALLAIGSLGSADYGVCVCVCSAHSLEGIFTIQMYGSQS